MKCGQVGPHGQHVTAAVRDLGPELVMEAHVRVLMRNLIHVLEEVAQVTFEYHIKLTTFIQDTTPINGQWGTWSSYSTCGTNCLKSRTRSCNNPSPSNGGSECQGYATLLYSCTDGSCPRSLSVWGSCSSYSACDSNCLKRRSRSRNGSECQGYDTYYYSCSEGDCPGEIKYQ